VRPVAAMVAAGFVAVACGGAPAPTTLPTIPPEVDYAASALRALAGTSFGFLDEGALAGLVVAACEGGADGDSVETAIAAAFAAVPTAGEGDREILREVVAVGVETVCPPAPTAQGLIEAYLGTVIAAADAAGAPAIDEIAILGAGPVVCDVLDAGGSPELAALEAARALFGVEAGSIREMSDSGELADAEAVVLGSVLGAASAILCPEHRAVVADFVAGL